MRTDEQKVKAREAMRKKRSDPIYHAYELERNRQYLRNNRAKRNESVRRYRARQMHNPEYRVQQSLNQQASYVRLRDRIFAAYGNVCACCGETERAFFEIDHVNGGGKKHLHSKSPITIYREMLKEGCPPIYRLLCANCNRGRQRNGGMCPHEQPTRS